MGSVKEFSAHIVVCLAVLKEITLLSAPVWAEMAFVRLLPRVDENVAAHPSARVKFLATNVAGIFP